jgi:hypothetical protein
LAKRLGIRVLEGHFDPAASVADGATPLFKRVIAELPSGVGINCENLDRISRGHPWRAKAYTADIVEAGTTKLEAEKSQGASQIAELRGKQSSNATLPDTIRRLAAMIDDCPTKQEIRRKVTALVPLGYGRVNMFRAPSVLLHGTWQLK